MIEQDKPSNDATCASNALVDCPSCGGHGHHGFEPDSGLPYDCYFCFNTGQVKAAEAAEYTECAEPSGEPDHGAR